MGPVVDLLKRTAEEHPDYEYYRDARWQQPAPRAHACCAQSLGQVQTRVTSNAATEAWNLWLQDAASTEQIASV